MPTKFTHAVFIGRFQPFHFGHLQVVREALAVAERLIICVGGSGETRRPRNPWTFQERAEMITASLAGEERTRVTVSPIQDHTYSEDAWLRDVQQSVSWLTRAHGVSEPRVALIGRHKDESSYYLRMFPQWGSVPVMASRELDATAIRERMFLKSELPLNECAGGVLDWLTTWMTSSEARRLREEYAFLERYQRTHDAGEYPRNNVCADAVVVQAGHVLLVRRRSHPGKGMLALPGGHIGRRETPLDACLRELREETAIKVPDAVLRGSIERFRVFDDPYRSGLARCYSHCWLIMLRGEGTRLARVRGGDDAESAMWVPLSEVRREDMFDDHYHIIAWMTGLS